MKENPIGKFVKKKSCAEFSNHKSSVKRSQTVNI